MDKVAVFEPTIFELWVRKIRATTNSLTSNKYNI